MEDVAIIKSSRNRNMLHDSGYTYYFDKLSKSGELKFWRCEKRRPPINCGARLHQDAQSSEILRHINEHSHAPDAARKEVLQSLAEVRDRAVTTRENTSQVIRNAVAGMSVAAKGQLPNEDLLKQKVRRKRKREDIAPAAPAILHDLVIPPHWAQYEKAPGDFRDFLLWDSGPGPHRILLFSTADNLDLLQQTTDWFCDGTFSVTPPLFAQLYTIHAEKMGAVLPLAYALLPNKNEATYRRLFEELKRLKPNLNPLRILTDFERAAINAIEAAFPNVQSLGCFFHFQQSIWRKIQDLGLQVRYRTDVDFGLAVRQFGALAFVPVDDVEHYFVQVADALEQYEGLSAVEQQQVVDLTNYFERTYLGLPNRRNNGRGQPLYHQQFWNVHDRCLNGMARTNNAVEAWHRGLKQTFNMSHPTIWKFITGLREEQKYRDTKIEGLVAGNPPRPRKKVYRDLDQRILTVVNDLPNRAALDFLRGIAHNLQF